MGRSLVRIAGGRRSRRAAGASALLGVLLVLAGCATVPNHSPARAVKVPARSTQDSQRPGPEKDATPLALVRSFVEASGNPEDSHAAARAYLGQRAADNWNANQQLIVIANSFDTVPGEKTDRDPRTKTVVLRGKEIGRLATDRAFRPDAGDIGPKIKLHKGADGQWRITDPPRGTIVTLSDFVRYYRRVQVYFFDDRLGIPVPDLRYVEIGSTEKLAGEVIDLLLAGPSEALRGAVHSALPKTAVNKGSVGPSSDGALLISLDHLGKQNVKEKTQIASQLVLSLRFANRPIRLQADGEPMFPDHPDWRRSDVPSYGKKIHPDKDEPGLVVTGHQIVSLADGSPVPGPAGTGSIPVLTAGQSIDGTRLAIVQKGETGVRLRVGKLGQSGAFVGVKAGSLTRPTWAPGNPQSGYAMWTVADGSTVYRVTSSGNGVWNPSKVDATSLTQLGTITELRLSRDGARVAAVVDGKLVVASVAHKKDGKVRISGAQVLQGGSLTSVVDVAWQDQTTLVVAAQSSNHPVVKVPVDGLQDQEFDLENLELPIKGLTAAAGRPVVVVDPDGLWQSLDVHEYWTPNPYPAGPGAIPFYPG